MTQDFRLLKTGEDAQVRKWYTETAEKRLLGQVKLVFLVLSSGWFPQRFRRTCRKPRFRMNEMPVYYAATRLIQTEATFARIPFANNAMNQCELLDLLKRQYYR